MLWKGRALATQECFAAAMTALLDEDEAASFRALFENAFPRYGGELLGYLAGECQEIGRVHRLLDLTHPFERLLEDPHPELVELIEAIPRRSQCPTEVSRA